MSARIQAKHKVSRRLGVNLWGSPKSSFNVRPTRPGQHGKSFKKRKISSYGLHLAEKQKVQFYYAMKEKQFRLFFKKAYYSKKNVSDEFIGMLESRLDIFVYRAKWAPTIFAAKQMIKHRHVLVNGQLVSINSYLLAPDDVITLKEEVKHYKVVKESMTRQDKEIPGYYESMDEGMTMKFLKVPAIEEVPYPYSLNMNLIVEYYSRKM